MPCLHHMMHVTAVMRFTGGALWKRPSLRHPLRKQKNPHRSEFITAVRFSTDTSVVQSSKPFVWLLARGSDDRLQM